MKKLRFKCFFYSFATLNFITEYGFNSQTINKILIIEQNILERFIIQTLKEIIEPKIKLVAQIVKTPGFKITTQKKKRKNIYVFIFLVLLVVFLFLVLINIFKKEEKPIDLGIFLFSAPRHTIGHVFKLKNELILDKNQGRLDFLGQFFINFFKHYDDYEKEFRESLNTLKQFEFLGEKTQFYGPIDEPQIKSIFTQDFYFYFASPGVYILDNKKNELKFLRIFKTQEEDIDQNFYLEMHKEKLEVQSMQEKEKNEIKKKFLEKRLEIIDSIFLCQNLRAISSKENDINTETKFEIHNEICANKLLEDYKDNQTIDFLTTLIKKTEEKHEEIFDELYKVQKQKTKTNFDQWRNEKDLIKKIKTMVEGCTLTEQDISCFALKKVFDELFA